jgi:AcrR family transcriptional regulator
VAAKKRAKSGSPQKRAPRHTPDLDQVLAVTATMLDRVGESGFRIEELIAATDVSKSSLYANFTDRDGLIGAARAAQFERIVKESIDGIRQLSTSVTTLDDLRRSLHAATVFTQALARNTERMRRLAIIAGTVGRPDFERSLTAAQTRLTDALEVIIRDGRSRGIVTTKHPDRTVATFIQAYTFGRVLSSFDTKRSKNDDAEWVKIVDDVVDHLLFDR